MDDLRQDLEAAFKAAETPEPAPVETPAPVEDPGTPEPIKEPDPRSRDEQGRFAKTDKPIGGDAPAAADTAVPAKVEPPKVDPVLAPQGWNGAGKVKWDKLPRPVQEAIAQDYQRLQAAESSYGPLSQILEPRKQALAAAYGSAENAVKTLFEMSDYAAKDAPGFIRWFAQQRGIDLATLNPTQEQPTGEQSHPVVQQLMGEIAGLKQQLQTLSTRTHDVTLQPIVAQIEAFSRDPKHVYFNDVKPDMVLLLEAGKAKTLDEAYEIATRMNPSVWTQIQASQAETALAERDQRTAQAKAAAASITGAPTPGVIDSPAAGTLREELERQFRLRA